MTNDDYPHTTEVPTDVLRQVIACLSYDAKAAYRHNNTRYADIRHGAGRMLAEHTEID